MKNIIILSQAPLTPQIKRNTFVDEYIMAGFHVEFWDISQCMHQGMRYNDELQEVYVRRILSLDQLDDFLKQINISDCVFVLDFDPFWNTRKIFRLLSRHNCYTVRIDAYANTSLKLNWKQKWSKLFSSRCLNILKTKSGILLYCVYKKYYHIAPFKHYFSSSSIVKRTDIINHPDYEEYAFTASPQVVDKPYILFVDTFFGHHPDDIYLFKYKNIPTTEAYQNSLDRFFTYLEKVYDMPVVIAAHPKSAYMNGEFGNRQVIKYQTKSLIVHAKFVILQLCNTISYVVLANKPVAFITTRGYDGLVLQKKGLRYLSKAVGKKVYNIDKCSYQEIEFTEIEEGLREQYKYTYLTDVQTEKKKNIEILRDSFKSILNDG